MGNGWLCFLKFPEWIQDWTSWHAPLPCRTCGSLSWSRFNWYFVVAWSLSSLSEVGVSVARALTLNISLFYDHDSDSMNDAFLPTLAPVITASKKIWGWYGESELVKQLAVLLCHLEVPLFTSQRPCHLYIIKTVDFEWSRSWQKIHHLRRQELGSDSRKMLRVDALTCSLHSPVIFIPQVANTKTKL